MYLGCSSFYLILIMLNLLEALKAELLEFLISVHMTWSKSFLCHAVFFFLRTPFNFPNQYQQVGQPKWWLLRVTANVTSGAFPPLGCGNYKHNRGLFLCSPVGAPFDGTEMEVKKAWDQYLHFPYSWVESALVFYPSLIGWKHDS